MRAHREVLNAPLLPRSCAKCCFGCIPAIDRSLAAGGEMAAGRDCASFNEFIQPKRPVDTAFLTAKKASLRSVLALMENQHPSQHSAPHCIGFTPACTLITSGFVLESCQLHPVPVKAPLLFYSPSLLSIIWLHRFWPITDYLQWSEDLAVCATVDPQKGFIRVCFWVYEKMRQGLFRGCTLVKVRGF